MWGHGTQRASWWNTWKRFHKSHTCARLELIVYKEFFMYVLLNCTMNWDACKRNCLIGTFIQHLTYFLLNFLRLFLDVGLQNCTPPPPFAPSLLLIQTKSSSHNALNLTKSQWFRFLWRYIAKTSEIYRKVNAVS